MEYSKEDLRNITEQSCETLLKEQPRLFLPQFDVNERTVSGELASKISNKIEGFHTNCEYNRMTDEHGNPIPKRIHLDPGDPNPSNVYPDIIIHRQEDGDHNLLIVEIKMSWKNSKKQNDLNKLERYMAELKYRFGLYLELGENGISEMEWFE